MTQHERSQCCPPRLSSVSFGAPRDERQVEKTTHVEFFTTVQEEEDLWSFFSDSAFMGGSGSAGSSSYLYREQPVGRGGRSAVQ
jgi:hypothetical protein